MQDIDSKKILWSVSKKGCEKVGFRLRVMLALVGLGGPYRTIFRSMPFPAFSGSDTEQPPKMPCLRAVQYFCKR